MQVQPMGFWQQLFDWIKDNTIMLSSVVLGWKAIDKGFKYLSEAREQELRKIVNEELGREIQPEIRNLREAIDSLKDSIWKLKDK